jgi:hypothetical protein
MILGKTNPSPIRIQVPGLQSTKEKSHSGKTLTLVNSADKGRVSMGKRVI